MLSFFSFDSLPDTITKSSKEKIAEIRDMIKMIVSNFVKIIGSFQIIMYIMIT